MKVTDANMNIGRQAYVREVEKLPEKKASVGKTDAAVPVPKDKVSLSGSSRDIHLAIEAAEAAPDERTEKVKRLKEEVANGSYRVDPQEIAGKLVDGAAGEII